jgi:CRP/FNR family transcriptional regulator, cyclic AMP receptor protein
MNSTEAPALADHEFVRGMSPEDVELLNGAAVSVSIPAGHRLFDEGAPAEKWWLLTGGHVALDMHIPGRPNLIVETLDRGDVLGFSWLAPPHRWQFGAETVEPTTAFELDGPDVMTLCGIHPELGYQLALRMLAAAVQRLQATRIRLLDLYGAPGQRAEAQWDSS